MELLAEKLVQLPDDVVGVNRGLGTFSTLAAPLVVSVQNLALRSGGYHQLRGCSNNIQISIDSATDTNGKIQRGDTVSKQLFLDNKVDSVDESSSKGLQLQ